MKDADIDVLSADGGQGSELTQAERDRRIGATILLHLRECWQCPHAGAELYRVASQAFLREMVQGRH